MAEKRKRPHPVQSVQQQIHSGSIIFGMVAATVVIFGSQYMIKTARARAATTAPRPMMRIGNVPSMGRVLAIENIARPPSYDCKRKIFTMI